MSREFDAAAALAVVGSMRDLRVQVELQTGVLLEIRKELGALREGVHQHCARVTCLDEAVDRLAVVVDEFRRQGRGEDGA